MRVGFFHDFKGGDTVLLTGSKDEIRVLHEAFERWWQSGAPCFAMHNLATTALLRSCELYAVRAGSPLPKGYCLVCDQSAYQTSRDLMEPLTEQGPGHQYLELHGGTARLIVSVDEYPDSWWREHG